MTIVWGRASPETPKVSDIRLEARVPSRSMEATAIRQGRKEECFGTCETTEAFISIHDPSSHGDSYRRSLWGQQRNRRNNHAGKNRSQSDPCLPCAPNTNSYANTNPNANPHTGAKNVIQQIP
jgi:hypothetical protein